MASALQAGYRLIDTAQAYGNEQAVGDAIRESGIKRGEVFVTTKLWIRDFSYDGALKATQVSLDRLGTDYIDLMLLHQRWATISARGARSKRCTARASYARSAWPTVTRTCSPICAKRLP